MVLFCKDVCFQLRCAISAPHPSPPRPRRPAPRCAPFQKRGSLSGGEEVQLALESPERRTPEIEAEKAEDVAGYLQQLVKSIVSSVLDPAPIALPLERQSFFVHFCFGGGSEGFGG